MIAPNAKKAESNLIIGNSLARVLKRKGNLMGHIVVTELLGRGVYFVIAVDPV